MPVEMSYFQDQPLRIGNQRQLLIDDYLVEDRWGLTRVLHQPEKYLRNPVLLKDKPWEGDVAYRPCVIHDEDYGRYRMWYQCFSASSYYGASGPAYFVCYAESDDGVNWEKPLLDVCAFPGFAQTNVVYCGTHYQKVSGVQVFRDADEEDPQRRYKMICVEERPGMGSCVNLACSPDGLRWQLVGDRHILDFHSDCYNHVVYDPGSRQWLLYCRPIVMNASGRRILEGQEGRRHMRRRVAVMTSPDFEHWSYPRTVMYPDEQDTPDYDSVSVFRYAGQFLMLYAAMEGEVTGTNEARLASSRDGLYWERYHTREALVPRGPEGAWDAGQVIAGCPPLRQGENLLLYYSGFTRPQHDTSRNGGVGLASLKLDHFVEQHADDAPGFLLTREFVLEGSQLRLNTTMRGRPYHQLGIRVEVARRPQLGEHGGNSTQACEGFSLEECKPIRGTRTDNPVSWKGNADLRALIGQPIYLRFEIRNMGLFSFQVLDA
jgi:hypothetical protein